MKKITTIQLENINNNVSKYVSENVSIHHNRKKQDFEFSTYQKLISEQSEEINNLELNKEYIFVGHIKRDMGCSGYSDFRPFIYIESLILLKETKCFYVTNKGRYLKDNVLCVCFDD